MEGKTEVLQMMEGKMEGKMEVLQTKAGRMGILGQRMMEGRMAEPRMMEGRTVLLDQG
jgi:hypothetical protein